MGINRNKSATLITALILGFCVAAIAGCSGKTYPFGKGRKAMARGVAKAPARLYLAALKGLPHKKSQRFYAYLAHEAAKRNMHFSSRRSSRTYSLTGHFSAARSRHGATFIYVWDIAGRTAINRHRWSGQKRTRLSANFWDTMDDRLMAQIARETVEGLAGWLSQLGHRMRQAPLLPPHMAANPQPPAQRRVQPIPPRLNAPPPHSRARNKPQRLTPGRMPAHRPRALSPARRSAFSVHVRRVTGTAPATALILSQTMRTQLRQAGYTIVQAGMPARIVISGMVRMTAPAGRRVPVTLSWQAHDHTGSRLGTVTQSNTIATAAIGGDWGGDARMAASAAADAIVRLMRNRR